MTLTVRLSPDLEKRFNALVRRQRRTKSEVVTQILTEFVTAREPKSAYEVALDVGVFEAPVEKAPTDLARDHKKYLVAALKAKHQR